MTPRERYRRIKLYHPPCHRDPRCDGYRKAPHRAAFVYLHAGRALCAECYVQWSIEGQVERVREAA